MSLSTLAAGGCFSVPTTEVSDLPTPNRVKEIHAWSCRRDGLDHDAARVLSLPLSALTLGAPKRAECIIIEGFSLTESPIQSITRVDFDADVKLFWYDGEARPELGLKVLPQTGCYLLGEAEGYFYPSSTTDDAAKNIESVLALITMARATPGRYVKPHKD